MARWEGTWGRKERTRIRIDDEWTHRLRELRGEGHAYYIGIKTGMKRRGDPRKST